MSMFQFVKRKLEIPEQTHNQSSSVRIPIKVSSYGNLNLFLTGFHNKVVENKANRHRAINDRRSLSLKMYQLNESRSTASDCLIKQNRLHNVSFYYHALFIYRYIVIVVFLFK